MTEMSASKFLYDEPADTLYISFSPGEPAVGLELNDHILLRVNKRDRRAIGITFFSFSHLMKRSELGPRSFPLSGLEELSPELRGLALELLHLPPVSEYLTVSAYSPAGSDVVPITLVNGDRLLAHAA